MNIVKYFVIFLIFSLLGWLYESIFFNNNMPDKLSKKLFNVDLPILPIYGLGAVFLIFIYESLYDYPLWIKVLVATIIINLMECLLGLCSNKFYGYKTWTYTDRMIPMCDGYISVMTIVWWTILIFIGYKILDIIYKNS